MRSVKLLLIIAGTISLLAISGTQLGLAEPDNRTSLEIKTEDDVLILEWHDNGAHLSDTVTALPDMPLIDMQDARLPAHLISVYVNHNRPIIPEVKDLQTRPWSGVLPTATIPIPENSAGQSRPALATATSPTPPDSPVVILREGRMRGQRIAVLALSPFFIDSETGKIHRVTHIEAQVPDVVLLEERPQMRDIMLAPPVNTHNAAEQSEEVRPRADHIIWFPLVSHNPPSNQADPEPSINPLAKQRAWKISVSQAGIQRLRGADLAAVGFNLDTLDTAYLQVWHNGIQVALEERGTTDGRLDTADELRFYATEPGDRWNVSDTYWLTVGSEPGLRMAAQFSAQIDTPVNNKAQMRGTWRNNSLYDSTLPGPDKDHWFAADLRTAPGQDVASLAIDLKFNLPTRAEVSHFTVYGSAYTDGPHHLELIMAGESQSVVWTGVGDWKQIFTFSTQPQPNIEVRLLPDAGRSGVQLDRVEWQVGVTLDVQGKGATFAFNLPSNQTVISNVAPGNTLYNITNSTYPLIVGTATSSEFKFSGDRANQYYLLAGNGTLHTPQIIAHNPYDLTTLRNIDALYIAPSLFHQALMPLIEHRRTQGLTIEIVDVQTIYDSWNYGQVSPQAIRNFLRYTMETWDRPPLAVTLVGDGTSDPLNYTGRDNINFIPPYLAYVDPWLGETACDTCYAQLDGDYPLDDPLPDVLMGRLPTKSVSEVAEVVAKIITYETSAQDAAWRNRAVFLTDNSFDANGLPDRAGDFIADATASIALQPPSLVIERLSYDPSPVHFTASWREPDHQQVSQRTRELLSNGAGLVTFFGHSDYWQWAVTSLSQKPSHLLELYEVDTLTNGERLPVVLAMTCFSSAFQRPAYSGTTIDERLVLHPAGGGVAVWGPTGQGVSYGHNFLQLGFYQELWLGALPSGQAPLGVLTQAGFETLFRHGNCCQSTLRTYVLLGDPLTQVRVGS